MTDPEKETDDQDASRQITIDGTVNESVVVSGSHNTVNVNVSNPQMNDVSPNLPSSNVPSKLYTEWIGREMEIESILSTLRNPSGKKLVGIYGIGGVGKSALAREVSERIQAEHTFPLVWFGGQQLSKRALIYLMKLALTVLFLTKSFSTVSRLGWASTLPYEESLYLTSNWLSCIPYLIFGR